MTPKYLKDEPIHEPKYLKDEITSSISLEVFKLICENLKLS